MQRLKTMVPFITLVFLLLTADAMAEKGPYDWALIQLDYVRKEKTDYLKRFTQKIHNVAKTAAADKQVLSFFEMNRQYDQAEKAGDIPVSLAQEIESLRKGFAAYYIANYFAFYDMLFVDTSGVSFYTIRSELDTRADLTANRQLFGDLGEALAQKPLQEAFIDFYHYRPSSEPAAFFIEPVYQNGTLSGWIILQWAVNKLNTIFAATGDMGQTGEAFLVNQTGQMLTESYFRDEPTILKQHLDDRNIKSKFKKGAGHLSVIDYRGQEALSSFEVFEFLGSRWLVVAKIDKAEITTEHYKTHRQYYNARLTNYLKGQSPPTEPPVISIKPGHPLRVDMDEFLKVSHNERLETWGVSTCTAFVATIPQRFAYLAHISPKDRIYGGTETNIVEQVTKKIKNFDIYPYQRRSVRFYIIAPHLVSIPSLMAQLTNEGFFLSQIWIGYNPAARSAAVISDYEAGSLVITWKSDPPQKGTTTMSHLQCVNAGDLVAAMVEKTTL